jgi:hypothetical protein
VAHALASARPVAVINCIGIVKQLPVAKDALRSIAVNALFPHQLAQLCVGPCPMMHLWIARQREISGLFGESRIVQRSVHGSSATTNTWRKRGGTMYVNESDHLEGAGKMKYPTHQTMMPSASLAVKSGLLAWMLGIVFLDWLMRCPGLGFIEPSLGIPLSGWRAFLLQFFHRDYIF